jgi:hypothetical protein
MSAFLRIVFYLGTLLLVFFAVVEVVLAITGVVATVAPGSLSGLLGN